MLSHRIWVEYPNLDRIKLPTWKMAEKTTFSRRKNATPKSKSANRFHLRSHARARTQQNFFKKGSLKTQKNVSFKKID